MKCHDVQRMISGFIEEKLTDEQLEGFLELEIIHRFRVLAAVPGAHDQIGVAVLPVEPKAVAQA